MAKNNTESNPFVQPLEIPCIWKLKKLPFGFTQAGKHTYAHAVLIDKENRASVYTTHLLDWFFELPASAKDMFMFISHKIGYETDVIELREDAYCAQVKVSHTTFHTAKTALTNRLIVPRTSRKHTYWVNPMYIYKGDRLNQYPDNAKPCNKNPLLKAIEESEAA